MSTKPQSNLGVNVDLLASALLHSARAAQRAPACIVAARPGETQAEAQRRAAAVRAKQR
jgi:hypothetical protein